MGPKINGGINWSLSELKKLVDNENSCVDFERAKRHIALHPFHLNDLNKALHEILSSSINFYDFELKGLLLSYKNPKLLSSLGSILYDSHFIHVDIEADFYVFKPEIGSILSGIVNKQAINHIGVLVHKVFNVSIPMNENDNEWRDHHAYVGREVMFTVTHVDFKGRLPFIRGELLSESMEDENSNHELNSSIISSKSANDDDSTCGDTTIQLETTIKSTKCANFLTSVLNQTSESSSEDEIEIPKKSLIQKKDKKSTLKRLEENKRQNNNEIKCKSLIQSPSIVKHSSNENCSDDNSFSKKDKKKLKQQKIVEETHCEDTEAQELTPKKSPKKKKYEENLLANIKIKREPDASDVENSSVDVKVRHKPIIVKTQTKNKTLSIKRKYKEENKNNLKIKYESDASDMGSTVVPKKKLKTIFSE